MTLQTLLNKRVVADDGAYMGKVFDFRARCQGPEVVVTHIRVGVATWVGRLRLQGWLRRLFSEARELELPWEAIGAVEDDIRLKPGWDRVRCEECSVRVAGGK